MLLLISLTIIITLFVYAYFFISQYQLQLPFTNNHILILTSHPDDECMFFGPIITSLKTMTRAKLHVVCLSSGNAEGLGSVRKKELTNSCQTLGISPSHIKLIDHPQLQDGMHTVWDINTISDIIHDFVTKNKIDTIITFDQQGVSGHVNHIAAYEGAKLYKKTHQHISLYLLESVPLIRKYIGIMDLMVQSKNKIRLVSSPLAYLWTHKAMRQHKSQLVWFRWLYVTFSRYMFINELVFSNSDS
ncbi:putative deacetylase LmbE-like domain-containing protein [Pilobolus umbonatus]|nr:putative deacetylase LmbE-like domain-containing protein [Pilobolus umbonatus]